MKRILIASIAALSVAATPALAVTTRSTPAAKTAAKQDKAQLKAAKASQKAAAKSAKLAAKNTKKPS